MSISSNRVFAAVAAAFVASAGLTAPAHAEDVRTMTISYKDLNLQSAAGQKALARRVAYAATKVCAQDDRTISAQAAVSACQSQAKDRAAADLAKAGVPAA